MSFSAAKWLNDNSGKFFPEKNGYYYTGDRTRFQYYTHAVDDHKLAAAIKQNVDDEKNNLARQNVVKQHDRNTKENALHVVLSDKIYRCLPSYENAENTLTSLDLTEVKYGKLDQNVDLLFNFKEFGKKDIGVDGEIRGYTTYYRHAHYESRTKQCGCCTYQVLVQTNPYHFESVDNRDQFESWVRSQYKGSEEALKQFIIDNHAVTLRPRIKSVKDRVEEQATQLLAVLLEPFKGDDNALYAVLMDRNAEGNTPLHCALSHRDSLYDKQMVVLQERIKLLSEAQKEALFLARGKLGKNLLHLATERLTLDFLNEKGFHFSVTTLKKGVVQGDNDGNTPLHDFCRSKNAYAHISFIHQKFKPQPKQASQSLFGTLQQIINPAEQKRVEPKEIKEPNVELEGAFAHNAANVGGHNPLHLACQRRQDAKQDTEIVAMLRDMMGEELFVRKQKQQDIKGCIPLHYAIATGNDAMVEGLLTKLPSKEKRAIAKIVDNKKQSALHYACQYGNQKILELVVAALGPVHVYRIYKEAEGVFGNDLKKLVKANSNLSLDSFDKLIKKETVLFETFDHLDGARPTKFAEHTKNRRADFKDCCQQLLIDKNLPEEPLNFTTGRSKEYHTRRMYFADADKTQLTQFPKFLLSRKSLFARDMQKLFPGAKMQTGTHAKPEPMNPKPAVNPKESHETQEITQGGTRGFHIASSCPSNTSI